MGVVVLVMDILYVVFWGQQVRNISCSGGGTQGVMTVHMADGQHIGRDISLELISQWIVD